jgi:ribosomal protein L2
MVDFMRKIPGPHEIVRFEYDPNRSGELCLLRNLATNEFSYILRGAEMKVGQVVYSYRDGLSSLATMEKFSKSDIVKPGNCLLLSDIPVGTRIHNIGLRKNGPAKICRSAGSYAQLLSTSPTGYAQIRLASKEVRMIPVTACATIGTVGNEAHKLRVWGKAGARRRKGWRPAVRGIAMSPYDHPHGGGSKSKGGKAPRSIWGWKTKGPRTVKRKRWFIITPRWKAAT